MSKLESVGGRKFIATMACCLITALLQGMGKLDADGSTYALVIVATVGAFITGNVVAKRDAAAGQGGGS